MALTRREFVALGVAAGASGFVGCGGVKDPQTTASASNPIVVENAKPGDPSWVLVKPASQGQIEGYASAPSANRGEQISFFVNTADATFTIEIFRTGWYGGAGARSMGPAVTLPGTVQPAPIIDPETLLTDAGNWTNPYVLTIPNNQSDPTDWCSGGYLAKLTGSSGHEAYVPFVVRDDGRRADLLFQTSITTYHAYNNWAGSSLYTTPRAFKVSLNRPYIPGWGQSTGSGHFQSWELNLVRFLERQGYDVKYNTDLDTHLNASELLLPKAFLSVGHDEYWSWQMRQNVTAARDANVNLAFLGADACYWQIRFEPSPVTGAPNRTIVCYKTDALSMDPLANGPQAYLTTTLWRDPPVNMPEAALIGVMYEDGEDWGYNTAMVVKDTSNFIFQGTGLSNGDSLLGLVGYEVDGLSQYSPPGTTVVAHSPVADPQDNFSGFADMTFYTAQSGATVVATGTNQWSWGLDDYNGTDHGVCTNPAAQQAMGNILQKFGAVPGL